MLKDFLADLTVFLLHSWFLMLLLGGARSEISTEVPAPGFVGSLFLVVLIGLIVGIARKAHDNYDR